ncbi:hypothetical protein BDF19DRAFT_113860 [Syncephalis fuscata]|nr:hypothetical protein BDF19DRAFT_113860 [Syncephalis fuscata]
MTTASNWAPELVKPLPASERIRIYVIRNEALIWHAMDVARLRDCYHITGTLVESLPRQPLQNIIHGLPLQLMAEEVTLLLELGIGRLVDETCAYRSPTSDEILAYEQLLREGERERDRAVAVQKQTTAAEHRTQQNTSSTDDNVIRVEDLVDSCSENKSLQTSVVAHVPTATPSVPWHIEQLGKNVYDTWIDAQKAGVWRFPSTVLEWRSFQVYRDLWRQGWWLGSGLKFGGQYLVYADNPRHCHSTFVATVCSPHEQHNFTHFVRLGRLGTAVRKTRLLCIVADPDNLTFEKEQLEIASKMLYSSVYYLRLEWSGW